MKEQNSEFTLWLVICAIIGLFIWQMPNIERFLFGRAKKDKTPVVVEEKKEDKKENNVSIKSGRVTCGSSLGENATEEYMLIYEENKVKKVILTTKTLYKTKNNEFNKAVKTCNEVSTKYSGQAGLLATCNADNLTIVDKKEFNLKTFSGATIQNSDGTVETISLEIKLNDDIKDATKVLINSGATCN